MSRAEPVAYSAERERPATVSRRAELGVAAASPVVAAALFLVCYEGGSFDLTSRCLLAVAVWWAVALGLVVRLWSSVAVTRASVVCGALLGAVVLVIGASAAWGTSTELVLDELTRAVLYLGIFVLLTLVACRVRTSTLADGVALAAAAVAAVALTSRLLPSLVSGDGGLGYVVPQIVTRLSYPVGYWNGLAILVGLALPCLLRTAVAARRAVVRSAAVAGVPLMAEVVYLTSSRGGAVVAAVGVVSFVALAPRPVEPLVPLTIGGIGSIGTVGLLLAESMVVNDPQSPAAAEQGRVVAALTVLICLATGAAHAAICRRIRVPQYVPRRARVAVALCCVAGAAGLAVAIHPIRLFHDFTAVPAVAASSPRPAQANPVESHLLSVSGTGRWQQWHLALREFWEHPLLGGGAGSYGGWYTAHSSSPGFVQDAHSLYFETLAELGLLGFIVLAAFFAVGLRTVLRARWTVPTGQQWSVAAFSATFVAWSFSLGIDWMWELPAVSIIGIGALAVVAEVGSLGPDATLHRSRRSRPLAGALALVATLAIISTGIPLLAQLRLEQSQGAARSGDVAAAVTRAQAARRLEPWAASPYTQLALVYEQDGRLTAARRWIGGALARDSSNWRLWIARARIEAKTGDISAARRSLARARALNPHSLLFS